MKFHIGYFIVRITIAICIILIIQIVFPAMGPQLATDIAIEQLQPSDEAAQVMRAWDGLLLASRIAMWTVLVGLFIPDLIWLMKKMKETQS